MSKVIHCKLSPEGIDKAIKEIEDYQKEIVEKTKKLAKRLATDGVHIAKFKISEKDAVYTAELLSSMQVRSGDVLQDGASYKIYTGCPWAAYVEFGTGVKGKGNPHPDVSIVGWRYDINEHGNGGWNYYRDGAWHHTSGMPSRPFMYETAQELSMEIAKIASEVFAEKGK